VVNDRTLERISAMPSTRLCAHAVPGHRHGGHVQRPDQGRGGGVNRPGRGHSPTASPALFCRWTLKATVAAPSGRPPHPRPADEGAQEVRSQAEHARRRSTRAIAGFSSGSRLGRANRVVGACAPSLTHISALAPVLGSASAWLAGDATQERSERKLGRSVLRWVLRAFAHAR